MIASVSLSSHSRSYVYMAITTGARNARKSKLTGISMSARLRERLLIRAASADFPDVAPDTVVVVGRLPDTGSSLICRLFAPDFSNGFWADDDGGGFLVVFLLNFFDC